MKRKVTILSAVLALAAIITTGLAYATSTTLCGGGVLGSKNFTVTQTEMQKLMSSGDPKYSFTLIDSEGNSRPLNLVEGVVTVPAEEGEYTLYASYTEYGTTYYSNGVSFTVKKPDPYWFYFGDTKTLVLKMGPDVPAGYGATVEGSKKIPSSISNGSSGSGWEAYRPEMVKVVVADEITAPADMSYWFIGAKDLVSLEGFEKLDTSNVTKMNGMFSDCSSLENISGLAEWDTGSVTWMNHMFNNCSSLKDISALTGWDTGSVTNMNYMFHNCALEFLSGLENWKTGSVTNMDNMFSGCHDITSVSVLADWDVGKVKTLSCIFMNCLALSDISGLAEWKTGSVTSMTSMFYRCSSLEDISALAAWDTSNVTNMNYMFHDCSGVTNWTSLNGWDVSKVTSYSGAFDSCKAPLPSWATADWQ